MGQTGTFDQGAGVSPQIFTKDNLGFLMISESQDLSLTSYPKDNRGWASFRGFHHRGEVSSGVPFLIATPDVLHTLNNAFVVMNMAGCSLFILCLLGVGGVFGDEVSVMEGDSVTLNSDVPKQHHEPMRWFYNDTLIALINGDRSTSCLYDGEDGIFRGRLEVNYQTGSLTITNTRPEHTGHYELEYIRRDGTGKSSSLNRNSTCNRTRIISKSISADEDIIKSFSVIVDTDPDKSSNDFNRIGKDGESDTSSGSSAGVTAGIVAVVLLLVFVAAGVVGVIYCRRRRSVERERNNRELL